jgi:hypothetical protein
MERQMANEEEKSVTLGVAAGFVVGVLWIAMALAALGQSHWGSAHQRSDWSLAWGIVGVLLLAAGVAAIAGALYHRSMVRNHQ